MDPSDYQRETRRTRPAGESKERALAHYALGLCEEAGELAGIIKKHVFYGQPIDRDALIKEAGDVLWYLASLLDTAGMNLGDALSVGADGLDSYDDVPELAVVALALLDNAVACSYYGWQVWNGDVPSRDDLSWRAANIAEYIARIASAVGATLDEVMTANLAKLRARYPGEGWTANDAAERKDEGPGLRFCACGRIQPECDGSRKACVATGKAKEIEAATAALAKLEVKG